MVDITMSIVHRRHAPATPMRVNWYMTSLIVGIITFCAVSWYGVWRLVAHFIR